MFRLWLLLASLGAVWSLAAAAGGPPADAAAGATPYRVVGGKADARTFNGFRRYHAGCNHCHGPDGIGSSFSPSLVERLPDIDSFRRIVLYGRRDGNLVMKGFAGDPNVAPHVDDLYAYLRARADGVLGRGRPGRLAP
jgi:mono/diheme cytochrome c family protein